MAQPFQMPIKRSPRKDPQQHRVYRMENSAIGARNYRTLKRADILALVRSVCRNYRVKAPLVRFRRVGKWAAEWSDIAGGLITLNPHKGTGQDLLTVTHELAHHVHHKLSKGRDEQHEAHGAEFMAVHMSILDTTRVIPIEGMRVIAKRWRVRYRDPGPNNNLIRLRRICRTKKNAPK